MVKVMHHGTVIRFICDHLDKEVYRQIEIEGNTERTERLKKSVVPLVPGTSIVLACSYIERIVYEIKKTVRDSGISQNQSIPKVSNLREIQRYFDLDVTWQGWEELGNFFRLRHCFAHEIGRVTDKQRYDITSFLNKLNKKEVLYDIEIVEPYFKIDNDEIIMFDRWNNRLRIILVDFLKLFDKHGLQLVSSQPSSVRL
jgi:hypothetical protein